jgi:hypothetical protein
MKARFAILAALALAALPAWGRSWLDAKLWFLGEGRADLMSLCDAGRQYNTKGSSIWNYSTRMKNEERMKAKGWSPSDIEAFSAGIAAAMAEVCPDVR